MGPRREPAHPGTKKKDTALERTRMCTPEDPDQGPYPKYVFIFTVIIHDNLPPGGFLSRERNLDMSPKF
jgi:hypothetical protein